MVILGNQGSYSSQKLSQLRRTYACITSSSIDQYHHQRVYIYLISQILLSLSKGVFLPFNAHSNSNGHITIFHILFFSFLYLFYLLPQLHPVCPSFYLQQLLLCCSTGGLLFLLPRLATRCTGFFIPHSNYSVFQISLPVPLNVQESSNIHY